MTWGTEGSGDIVGVHTTGDGGTGARQGRGGPPLVPVGACVMARRGRLGAAEGCSLSRCGSTR